MQRSENCTTCAQQSRALGIHDPMGQMLKHRPLFFDWDNEAADYEFVVAGAILVRAMFQTTRSLLIAANGTKFERGKNSQTQDRGRVQTLLFCFDLTEVLHDLL